MTADRVSGLKIGYRKGNKLAGLYDRGDWLVRFDTLGPAMEAGLPATVVVDRPVIQQILVKHGFPEGAAACSAQCAGACGGGRCGRLYALSAQWGRLPSLSVHSRGGPAAAVAAAASTAPKARGARTHPRAQI